MKTINILILFILASSNLFSNEIDRKFGKVSREELLMNVYEKDSSAEAVILFDVGNTRFEYETGNGFIMIFERHVRLKIFNVDGFEYADFEIPLYKDNEYIEKISQIKAVTYNIENDKIVKSKLKNNDIFLVDETRNESLKKFSMPQVKEGSVIEVSYSIRSQFYYNLQKWSFQNYIPTLWSEYTVEIPDYYTYNTIVKGYLSFEINNIEILSDYLTITTKTRSNEGKVGVPNTKTSFNTQKIDFQKRVTKYAIKEAPAMKKEAFMLSPRNYISSVEFELAQIHFPGQSVKEYSTTWESINKKLLEHSDFGGQINNGHYLSNIIKEIKSKTDNKEEQINLYYQYLLNNYKWNERNSLFTSKNLRKTFNDKFGNSADLNLLMLLLLKEAGFDVYPVVLSTRGHGVLNLVYPSISQMNYVVTLLKFDSEEYLIDVTDPKCYLGMLPPKCINDKGRIVSRTKSDWIDIKPVKDYVLTYFGSFEINDNGISGMLMGKYDGFASYNLRKNYYKYKSEDDFIDEIESDNPGIEIGEYKFENINEVNIPVQNKFNSVSFKNVDKLNSIIYFNPVVIDRIENNPFKLSERKYPVDYNYPYKQKYTFNYKIPDEYTIEELPKSEQFELPGGSGKFLYLIKQSGNTIQLTILLNINKRQYLPNEYEVLKDFYNRIITKEKEQVVLKRS